MSNTPFKCSDNAEMNYSLPGAVLLNAVHSVDELLTNEKQPNGVGAVDCSIKNNNLRSVYQGSGEKAMKTDDKEQFVIVGSCAAPNCGRFIVSGQTAVRHGHALCCNYSCLTQYMFSGARRG